jgi:hypothetical protein
VSAARLARSARATGPLALWRSLAGPQCAQRVVRMSGEDGRPLIPSHEHKRQAERGRRQGSLPVRVVTLVTRSAASRARPGGVAA